MVNLSIKLLQFVCPYCLFSDENEQVYASIVIAILSW